MDKKIRREVDFVFLFFLLTLVFIGLVTILSATYFPANIKYHDSFYFFKRQMLWALLGSVAAFFVFYTDYSHLMIMERLLYGGTVIVLLLVLFIGKESGGAQRWISIGPFPFQPSEFSKFALILCYASHLTRRHPVSVFDFILSLVYVFPFFALVFLQPDLGTSLVFMVIAAGMLFVAGVPLKHLGITAAAGIAVFPVAWHILKDYQKRRLLIFLDPSVDPLGAGYHLIQSKIALGSGGLLGHGLFAGTQTKLHFVPGAHTDFIFSVLGETFGFLGCFLFLLFFLLLLMKVFSIAFLSKDEFGRIAVCGIASMWFFHLVVNVGMTMGVMPITGIPLPFLSFGGSALMTNLLCSGFILNVYARRKKINF